jgi:orotate phosphoribosyltransferase-like protein
MTTTQRRNKIIELKNKGFSYGAIAKLFNISRARVHQIYSGYTTSSKGGRGKLRYSIMERDNFTCQWGELCEGKPMSYCSDKMIMHHIDFDDRNNNPSNLITMCRSCHSKFHSSFHINDKIEKKLQKR